MDRTSIVITLYSTSFGELLLLNTNPYGQREPCICCCFNPLLICPSGSFFLPALLVVPVFVSSLADSLHVTLFYFSRVVEHMKTVKFIFTCFGFHQPRGPGPHRPRKLGIHGSGICNSAFSPLLLLVLLLVIFATGVSRGTRRIKLFTDNRLRRRRTDRVL